MHKWPIGDVENKNLRNPWKLRVQRQADQAALPIIGYMQRKDWLFQNAAVSPHQQLPGLVRDKNPAVRGGSDRGDSVQVGREKFCLESVRNFNRVEDTARKGSRTRSIRQMSIRGEISPSNLDWARVECSDKKFVLPSCLREVP